MLRTLSYVIFSSFLIFAFLATFHIPGASAFSQTPKDADKDGVPDTSDSCTNTPPGSTVNDSGCSLSQIDTDGDGYFDDVDEFINNPGEWNDFDGDGVGDNSDPDNDNDNVQNIDDIFPFDASEWADLDGDGIGDNSDTDVDGDGVENLFDAFPLDPEEWSDIDSDGVGDNSDTDRDGDGVDNSLDLFPEDPLESADLDGDGIGDNSDPDVDGDSVNNLDDVFPFDPSESFDIDADGIGDNADIDRDGDGVANVDDVFPSDPLENSDMDGDGIGDNSDTDRDGDGVENILDIFPNDASENADLDGDGIGDNSDSDADGDGISNTLDSFPFDSTEWLDSDGDGIGDNSDLDRDGDGYSNTDESSYGTDPDDVSSYPADLDADGIPDVNDSDIDGDGVDNDSDLFPTDPLESSDLDSDGIGDNSDVDIDGDGILNIDDAFPYDSSEIGDLDGDGVGDNTDLDRDGDGFGNDMDVFPDDINEWLDSDLDGIGNNADLDRDGDGIVNSEDNFPDDPTEFSDYDQDGLGDNSDNDIDGDGVINDSDICPYTPLLVAVNEQGCELERTPLEDLVGDNILMGTEYINFILGYSGNDEITGAAGDDILVGGEGDDSYIFSKTSGNDIVFDVLGYNTIIFDSSVVKSDVTSGFVKSNNDLILNVASGASSIRVLDFFLYSNSIEKLQFSDGSEISASQIYSIYGVSQPSLLGVGKEIVLGTSFTESLEAFEDIPSVILGGLGHDDILSLEQDDFMVGGVGDDIYIKVADGSKDSVFDLDGQNLVRFFGISSINEATGSLQKDGDDLILNLTGNGGSLRVFKFFSYVNTIRRFVADDDSYIEASQLYTLFEVTEPTQESSIFDLLRPEPTPDDADFDGVNDAYDLCAETEFGVPVDANGCVDSDEDGVGDISDKCPDTPWNELSSIDVNGCSLEQRDSDGDGVENSNDAFPNDPTEWSDTDLDGIGDNADEDIDGDSYNNDVDAFPNDAAEWSDLDGDGIGDNSDLDRDGDGYSNELELSYLTDPDNFLSHPEDNDGDGIPDDVDPDIDGDGYANQDDVFPYDYNEFEDYDGDGVGDNSDTDLDNDGYLNSIDAFPFDESEHLDTDKDLIGDFADLDDDGDNYSDEFEIQELTDPLNSHDRPGSSKPIANTSTVITTGANTSFYANDDAASNSGIPFRFERDNEQNIVLDLATHLRWQDVDDNSLLRLDYSSANSYCSSLEQGGYDDWRLPSIDEWFYLMNIGQFRTDAGVELLNSVFIHKYTSRPYGSPSGYWSSTSSGSGVDVINIWGGNIISTNTTYDNIMVRCVQGTPVTKTPSIAKTSLDSVVYDRTNNLMWQDDESIFDAKYTWEDALDYCEALDLDGLNDWRLPNYKEAYSHLSAIYNYYPSTTVFENTYTGQTGLFYEDWWTSSTYRSSTYPNEKAFSYQVRSQYWKLTGNTKSQSFFVRCVRDYHAPVIIVSGNRNVELFEELTLSTSSSYANDSSPIDIEWYAVGTGELLGTNDTQTVSFSETGDHSIRIDLTDTLGVKVSHVITVHVSNDIGLLPPVANAGADSTLYIGGSYEFNATASYDEDGTITLYEWTLNDQVISNEAIFSYSFDSVGTYEVTLKVVDNDGLEGVDTIVLNIGDGAPIANAGADITVLPFEEYTLSASASYDVNGSVLTYQWIHDGYIVGSDSEFSSAGSAVGTYLYTLKVIDESGLSSEDDINVIVDYTSDEIYSLSECISPAPLDDGDYEDIYPDNDINWIGNTITDVTDIERAFNYARKLDPTVSVYLVMPSQNTWDSMTVSEQSLYLINSERISRGLIPYEGISSELVAVAQEYANYMADNTAPFSHEADGRTPSERIDANGTIGGRRDYSISNEDIYAGSSVAIAIYKFIYVDKTPYSGDAWGHRSSILSVGLTDRSLESNQEGIIGAAVSNNPYTYLNADQNDGLYVLNLLDPDESWVENEITRVDSSGSYGCKNTENLSVEPGGLDVTAIKSITLLNNWAHLSTGETLTLNVIATLDDGSGIDISNYVAIANSDILSFISIDQGVLTGLYPGKVTVRVLYEGIVSNPIQITISDPINRPEESLLELGDLAKFIPENSTYNKYDPMAFSTFTGIVIDQNESPISGVQVSFSGAPELGYVETDTNGRYILAAPAGMQTLQFSHVGYTTAQRRKIGSSSAWASLDDVMLLEQDSKVTDIVLGGSEPVIHRSSTITDEFGTRNTTLVFNGINTATVYSADGYVQTLSEIEVSATEFTDIRAMPGELPQDSAFTYCADLNIKGTHFTDNVVFDGDVVMFVDNFLNFDVGEIVPIGYYDENKSEWVASDNGVVVRVIDANGDGQVDGIDYNDDGIPDDLNKNGSTEDDVIGAEDYSHGDTLWWGKFNHFTPVDYNFDTSDLSAENASILDASAYAEVQREDEHNDDFVCTGSYVAPYQQSFHEDIPIAGTGMTLHYTSQRSSGYQHKVNVQITGKETPSGLDRIFVHLNVAGHTFKKEMGTSLNQYAEFIWDGLDILGNRPDGSIAGEIAIGYAFHPDYTSVGSLNGSGESIDSIGRAWNQPATDSTGVQAREYSIAWVTRPVSFINSYKSQIADGWFLSGYHELLGGNTIYLGNGSVDNIRGMSGIVSTGVATTIIEGDDAYYGNPGVPINYGIGVSGTAFDYQTGLEWEGSDTQISVGSKNEALDHCSSIKIKNSNGWRIPTAKESSYSAAKTSGSKTQQFLKFGNAHTGTHYYSYGLTPLVCVAGRIYDDILTNDLVRDDILDIVTDTDNGLMWQDSDDNESVQLDWQSAINYCETSEHAGFDDWRLPTVNELLYINPNSTFNKKTEIQWPSSDSVWSYNVEFQRAYWSSTPNDFLQGRAWGVESNSYSSDQFEMVNEQYVRCVRKDSKVISSPYKFDSLGRHISTIDVDTGKDLYTFEYDDDNNLEGIKDQFGNRIIIQGDDSGVIRTIISPDGRRTELDVDNRGLLQSVTYDSGESYQFEYLNNLLTKKTEPNGNPFYHEFDAYGRVDRTYDNEGGEWNFYDIYEGSGTRRYGFTTAENQSYETVSKTLTDGWVQTDTTEKNGTRVVKLRAGDNLYEIITIDGVTTRVEKVVDIRTHDEIPSSVRITQPSLLESKTTYSKVYGSHDTDFSKYELTTTVNGKASVLSYDSNAGTRLFVTPEGRTSTTFFDITTLKTTRTLIDGFTETTYDYDTRGRLQTVTTGNRITSYTYDSVTGKVASVTTGSQTTWYMYDIAGRLWKIETPDGHITEYGYDANGNVTSTIVPVAKTHTSPVNKVNKVASVSTPLHAETIYEYDRDRRLTTTILPSQQRIVNTYSNGVLAQTTTPESTIDYDYINGNQLQRVTEGSEVMSLGYDGNLLTSTTYSGELSGSIIYGYNNDFLINSMSYAGSSASLGYDNDSLLTSINGFTIARDLAHGLPTQVGKNNYSVGLTYNGYGEVKTRHQEVLGVGIDTTYTYKTTGQIETRTDIVDLGNTTRTDRYEYIYNNRNRLDSVILNGELVEQYDYDENGNRRLSTSVRSLIDGVVANYNDDDQLTSSGNQTYTYDSNGRLASKIRITDDNAIITTTYEYSSQGRLLKVVTPTNTIEYRHNALGNRVAKLVDGDVVEKYLWENKTRLLATYDGNNNLKQRYEYTIGNTPTAYTEGSNRYYILTDQLGSPRMVTGEDGTLLREIEYDSFGNIVADSAPEIELPFGFAGGLYDNDTSLIRFGYRDYDPETGRWTARDPIGFDGGDTNLYGYVLGDPVNGIDPSGLEFEVVKSYGGDYSGKSTYDTELCWTCNDGTAVPVPSTEKTWFLEGNGDVEWTPVDEIDSIFLEILRPVFIDGEDGTYGREINSWRDLDGNIKRDLLDKNFCE